MKFTACTHSGKNTDVYILEFVDVDTLLSALDGFREDVDAAVFAIEYQLDHLGPRCPVAHVAPQLECQRVAHHRDIVIGCQQYPVAVGGHVQQGDILFLAVVITQFKGVFLLIETERAVASQFDANVTVVAFRLHVGRHFLRGVQLGIGGNGDNWQSGRLRTGIQRHNEECQQ